MTSKQLKLIKDFSKPFYYKTGKYHGWDHILAVKKNVLRLEKSLKNVNKNILISSCYLHDIGRSIKDQGHPEESANLANPYLVKIGLQSKEIGAILHCIVSHDREKILSAKSVEAKIFFDADKLEILSINGFMRTCLWLVEERKMKLDKAVNFLWEWIILTRKKYIQTKKAREIIDTELVVLKKFVSHFNNW